MKGMKLVALLPAALTLLAAVAAPRAVAAQAASVSKLDPVAATQTYLASVPADKRARSDAYFEGGYWLQLWDFLIGAGIALLLLTRRWSGRMRDFAERLTRRKPVQTFVYWAQYFAVIVLISLPMTIYEGFIREHAYGLATQGFGGWLGDQAKGWALGLVFGGVFVALLYGVIRRVPRTWWLWGSVVTIVFLAFVQFIAPVFIMPLFNKYTRLADPVVREPILQMARANGIDATDVWVADASRQSTRVSANVSGFLGTERITLNDNLLNRCSLAEIEAVMGHEMGHYVMNHVYKGFLFFAVVAMIGFAFLRWAFDVVARRKGEAWGIRGIGDVAGLPLLGLLLSVFFFVLTPITNSYIRIGEIEADMYGLNAARQPDGEAEVDLKLGEYRKLDPGNIEEIIFFDHPSGRNRILMAMKWKAENLPAAGPTSSPSPASSPAVLKP
jgi:STE24 endopeptidase